MGPDEKMRFITGMKSVLSELRQRNVREFEKIADAIVGFRREFGGGRWMD